MEKETKSKGDSLCESALDHVVMVDVATLPCLWDYHKEFNESFESVKPQLDQLLCVSLTQSDA